MLLDFEKDDLAKAMSPNKKMFQLAKTQKIKRDKKEDDSDEGENRNSTTPKLPPIQESGEEFINQESV